MMKQITNDVPKMVLVAFEELPHDASLVHQAWWAS
jgi:hypothetical protein